MRIRAVRFALLAVVTGLLTSLGSALPQAAFGDGDALNITFASGTLTMAGSSASQPSYLFVWVQKKSAQGCGATGSDEQNSPIGTLDAAYTRSYTLGVGPFSEQITNVTESTGVYTVCGYLVHPSTDPHALGPLYTTPAVLTATDVSFGGCGDPTMTITNVEIYSSATYGVEYPTVVLTAHVADDPSNTGVVDVIHPHRDNLNDQAWGSVDQLAPDTLQLKIQDLPQPGDTVDYPITYTPPGGDHCLLPDGTVATSNHSTTTVAVTYFAPYEGGSASIDGVTLPGSDAAPTAPTRSTTAVGGTLRVGSTITCLGPALLPGYTEGGYQWFQDGGIVATTRTLVLPGKWWGVQPPICHMHLTTPSGVQLPVYQAYTPMPKIALGPALRSTSAPRLSGRHRVGTIETVSRGSWSPAAKSYAYQWYAGTTKIPGATAASYRIPAKYKGKRLSCRVVAHTYGWASGAAKTTAVTVS